MIILSIHNCYCQLLVTSSIKDNEGAGTVGPVNGVIIAAFLISGLSALLIIILIVVLFAVLLYL